MVVAKAVLLMVTALQASAPGEFAVTIVGASKIEDPPIAIVSTIVKADPALSSLVVNPLVAKSKAPTV